MKKTILVLFGGCSAEYAVSLQSAYGVLTHLDRDRYEILTMGIDQEGLWYLYEGPWEKIPQDTWKEASCRRAFLLPDRQIHGIFCETEEGGRYRRIDVLLPVLHGKNGEDGTVQGIAEAAGIPVAGCGVLASALAMDKHRAHILAEAAGIAAPRGTVVQGADADEVIWKAAEGLSGPLFVKPVRSGSSFGITRVTDRGQLPEAVRKAAAYDREVLLEEQVDGVEIGCGVLGTGRLVTGRPDEIQLSGGFFDYEEKYTLKTSKIHMPARISAETEEQVRKSARQVYRALDCSGFARVDFFLTRDGKLYFNEVNTIPGMTAHSRYPAMMQGIGLSLSEVLEQLLEEACP